MLADNRWDSRFPGSVRHVGFVLNEPRTERSVTGPQPNKEDVVGDDAADRKIREALALAEIGRAVNESERLEDLYARTAEWVQKLVPADRVVIALVDRTSGELRREYVTGIESARPGSPPDQRVRPGVLDEVRQSGIPVRIDDIAGVVDRFPGAKMLVDLGFQSGIYAPLLVRGEVIGVVGTDVRALAAYTDADVELLSRIAIQVSGALANAELRLELDIKATEEALLAEISRIVTSSPSFGDVFEPIAAAISRAIPHDRIAMASIDVEAEQAHTRFVSGLIAEGFPPGDIHPLPPQILDAHHLKSDGELFQSSEIQRSFENLPVAPLMTGELRSGMRANLRSHGDLVGNLIVRSTSENAYGESDLQLLMRIARQLSGAFANSELHAEVDRRAQEESVLARIGRAVTADLGIDELCRGLAESVSPLIPYDRIAVALVDPDTATATTVFADGVAVGEFETGDAFPAEHYSELWDSDSRTALVDSDYDHFDDDMTFVNMGLHSSLGVPLFWQNECIGVLSFRSRQARTYSARHIDLANRIADQITGAFVNAGLHSTANRRAKEEEVLAAIGRLVSSSLDFGSTFDELARSVEQLIPYDRFVIMGLDVESQMIWTHYVAGIEVQGWGPGTSRAISGWRPGSNPEMDQEGRLSDRDEGPESDGNAALWAGVPALVSVPLIWENRTIGNVALRSKTEGRFTEHHLELAARVAQQISGAFVNSELHAITAGEAAERSALAEVGRLVSSSLDVVEMFDAIAEPFRELVPYDRLVVTTFDSSTRTWTTRFVAGQSVEGYEVGDRHSDEDSALREALEGILPRVVSGDGTPGVITTQTLATSLGLHSALLVPLVVNGELIGAMSARSREVNAYNQRHLELSRRIADQVSGSVANSELHRSLFDVEARTRAVVETASVGIVTANSRLEIETANDAVLAIFGYEREELIGQNVLVLASEPFRSEHDDYVERYNVSGERRIIGLVREVEGRRKDGTEFPIELEVTQVDLDHGKMYTGLIRDITDRKKSESEVTELTATLERRVVERTSDLQDANDRLEEANAQLESFSYMVSHDLRGPLSMSAQLASRLLESGSEELSESSRTYLELIERSSRKSSEFVTDLLNFARLGQQAMAIQRLDPGEIVSSVAGEFSEQNPDIQWSLADMQLCDADPTLLRAVFTNLIGNACKFTSSETNPSVEVGSEDVDGELAYYVRDNGVGFDMAEADRLFDVFERLHRPEDYPGTGAGLAIVRRIIERHGGRVWAEAAIDQGATFFFTVPSIE